MGHIRLGKLPQSKKWRVVVGLIEGDASTLAVANAAAEAAERDMARMPGDPVFGYVLQLLATLPRNARLPTFEDDLGAHGISTADFVSVGQLLEVLNGAVERRAAEIGRASDAGDIARAAFLESLSVQLRDRLPSLFDPTPADIRQALASFSSGQNFGLLARDFFARLTYRTLDYYLSRELANHTGNGARFASDADRTAFQHDLARYTYEASRIVEDFAGGWYGKTVWQKQSLDSVEVEKFARFALKKMRGELERRRDSG